MNRTAISCLALLFASQAAIASSHTKMAAHSVSAPAGIVGEVTKAGHWNFNYTYGMDTFDKWTQGSGELDDADAKALAGTYYAKKLEVESHTLTASMGLSDSASVFVTVPYLKKTMDAEVSSVGRSDRVDGLGDAELGWATKIAYMDNHCYAFSVAAILPTGETNEKMMVGASKKVMPYVMQLGGGSYGLHPVVHYRGYEGAWSWGAEAGGMFYFGENDQGYRSGKKFNLDGWFQRSLGDMVAASLRLSMNSQGENYGGSDDKDMDVSLTPLNDINNMEFTRFTAHAGLTAFFGGAKLSVEYGMPVHYSAGGLQLQMNDSWRASLSMGF